MDNPHAEEDEYIKDIENAILDAQIEGAEDMVLAIINLRFSNGLSIASIEKILNDYKEEINAKRRG